jgi:hypothetical protein
LDGLHDAGGPAGAAAQLGEIFHRFEGGVGAFTVGADPGVDAVELFVPVGVGASAFVFLVRGDDRCAGALVGAVSESDDPGVGEGVDQAVGARRGQVVCSAGQGG